MGIVIGAAFGTIVKSFVDDVLMSPLGLFVPPDACATHRLEARATVAPTSDIKANLDDIPFLNGVVPVHQPHQPSGAGFLPVVDRH